MTRLADKTSKVNCSAHRGGTISGSESRFTKTQVNCTEKSPWQKRDLADRKKKILHDQGEHSYEEDCDQYVASWALNNNNYLVHWLVDVPVREKVYLRGGSV